MPIVVATCSINVGLYKDSANTEQQRQDDGNFRIHWPVLILIQNNEQNEYQKRYCLLSEQGETIAKRP